MSFEASVMKLLAELGPGPVFVHSDAFEAARLVTRSRNRLALLDAHITLLRSVSKDRDLWMPAFNYDFPRTRVFDIAADQAQIGPVPELFRTTVAAWRTPVPMFSVSGTGRVPDVSWGDNVDPFGDASIFARLVKGEGVVLYYGNTFAFNTIIHYAEREFGGPPYRYDKAFAGHVVMADAVRVPGSLCSHVRPLGRELDYDWARLLTQAFDAGACRSVDGTPEVLAASARDLCDFWIAMLTRDPLALLDQQSRAWVEPALDKLGRRFTIGDFELPDLSTNQA